MKRSDKYTDDYIEQRYESQRPYYILSTNRETTEKEKVKEFS